MEGIAYAEALQEGGAAFWKLDKGWCGWREKVLLVPEAREVGKDQITGPVVHV